jgi:hypothetical protein
MLLICDVTEEAASQRYTPVEVEMVGAGACMLFVVCQLQYYAACSWLVGLHPALILRFGRMWHVVGYTPPTRAGERWQVHVRASEAGSSRAAVGTAGRHVTCDSANCNEWPRSTGRPISRAGQQKCSSARSFPL